ncbi:hypothetical protein [Nonomuraea maritima]|uniref:hypothetical protein n=1 Tax=Nonomuraea maritima TaxID=683260 RepID=UPI003716C2EC
MSTRMYREGDSVTLTIPGVIDRVDPEDPARHHLRYGDHGLVSFRTDDASIDHVLMATADWPPLPGDIWRDRNRKRWFCQVDPDQPDLIVLTSEFGATYIGEHGLMKAVRNYGTFHLEIPGSVRLEREGGR